MRTRSMVTLQGTAMPEATLCELHWHDNTSKRAAMHAAIASGDTFQVLPQDTTDNPEVACIVCGRHGDRKGY